jgi:hypothetical protein
MGVVADEEIIAELDADREDEDQIEDDEDADFEIEERGTDDSSVMKIYLKAIQERLRKEMSTSTMMKNSNEKWLLELLEEDEWWIKSKRARKVSRKLGLLFAEKLYYRDARVWLPELQNTGKNVCRRASLAGAIAKLACTPTRRKRLLVKSLR